MNEKIFIKQHAGTFAKRCKYFAGIDFTDPCKTCKAGVVMQDVIVKQGYKYRYQGDSGTAYTASYSMPCFRDDDPLGVCHCDKQEFPTAEEVEADKKEIAELFSRTTRARAAIVAHLGGPWKRGTKGAGGVIDCPVCGAKESLRFTRAGVNGHIHAACKTEGCVSWME